MPSPYLRRAVQLFFILIFLTLFVATTYRGGNEVHYPINVFFQVDPLTAIGNILATKSFEGFVDFFLPSLIILLATIIIGRFFCGWVCPVGGVLDLLRPVVYGGKARARGAEGGLWLKNAKFPKSLKYYLLIIILIPTLFSVNLTGIFDPLSIAIRSLTIAIYPLFSSLSFSIFSWLFGFDLPVITPVTDATYGFLSRIILPFKQGFFALSIFSLAIFLGIIIAERIRPRFWCRYLCPLGAVLSIFATFSFLKRTPARLCKDCQDCSDNCIMDAFSEFEKGGDFLKGECILTEDCVTLCQKGRVENTLSLKSIRSRGGRSDIRRRYVITSAIAGLFVQPLLSVSPVRKLKKEGGINFLIRPPGAMDEAEFIERCIKCTECMMVCPTGGLQPDIAMGGLESIYSPVLVPRIGYCEYLCTLCGQVCPTDAIRELKVDEKKETVIGKAYIDTDRCLPWAHNVNCIVCEEHCPTADKAIKYHKWKEGDEPSTDGSPLKKPYVIYDLCVGCGICENKCPIGGRSAIIVTSMKEEI
ncbi:MAG: 4Fe-4S binding protein [Deltaproteobacteria bacterium]|uniref:4Fe-4S binding protein n=1 Tax=Candidatus Zymogenus saltonus TaxID=2844893 RepID=A0A9D8KEB4_9DELT|nr:4Fe-4S binding protein [Candidatus Zymogenus saltonus]